MRVQFQYNLFSDVKNWSRIIRSKHNSSNVSWEYKIKGIPKELLDKVLKSNEKDGLEIIKDYLKIQNKKRRDIIKLSIDCLEKSWSKRENSYFKALERVLEKKISIANYQADITTMYFSPYYWPRNWFMITLWSPLPKQLTAIAHEIFHIEFLKHYNDFLNEYNLEKDKTIDIVESLTCLLNIDEFKNTLIVPDRGYEKHKKIRNYIFKKHKKQQNFEKLLKDIVALIIKK